MNVDAFRRLPAARKLAAPIVALVGDERFFRAEAVDELKAAAAGGAAAGASGANVVEIEGSPGPRKVADLGAALDELATPSLFGGQRLVVVREADAFVAAHRERLEAYIHAPAPRATLVLDLDALAKNLRLTKAIEAKGLLVECRRLYETPPPWGPPRAPWESELVDWTVRRAAERGKRLGREDAYRLVSLAGNDLFEIASTVEKLALAAGERPDIPPDEVERLTARARRDDVFTLADAVGRRDLAKALAALDSLLTWGYVDRDGGVLRDEGRIAAIVLGRLRRKLEEIERGIAFVEAGGRGDDRALAAAAGAHPAFARRLADEVRTFRAEDLEACLGAIAEADLALKGVTAQRFPARLALERALVRLCRGRETRRPAPQAVPPRDY